MNEDINKTLAALTVALNAASERIKSIEAVRVWQMSHQWYIEYAEITYNNGQVRYVCIDCDSDRAAIFDIVRAICREEFEDVGHFEIERNVYKQYDPQLANEGTTDGNNA